MSLKIPAIRSKMGIWVYYISSLSFSEISKYVKPINDELHKSELLSGMIQRSITENYKNIANYLETQDERFFNSLVLAVYDGQPVWNEIRISEDSGDDNYNLGLITLSDDVKIFPVDGQHRVEGIKTALDNNDTFSDERVPVIFIGHSKDETGMQRTRRMFSTLNRYAKPVSLRDIIALDEDDVVAIASRNLIDNANLFCKERIFDSRNKSVPDNNDMALTTIISYYECNKELLWLHIKNKVVRGLDGKVKKGHSKIAEYIRHRPSDDEIALFTDECKNFWSAVIDECPEIKECDAQVGEYRNNNGGHIFFRPITLLSFVKACVTIKSATQKTYKEIIDSYPKELLWIQNRLWKKIVWDDVLKRMVMGNAKTIQTILLYIYDPNLVTEVDLKKMVLSLQSIWDIDDEILVKERLDAIISGDTYI